MTSRPLDTTSSSWSRHRAVLARMDGATRLEVAVDLSETVREIRLSGIRSRHPELSLRGAIAWLVAEDYGVELPDGK